MSLWEYKVITSGKGGFATPALLEKFLNDLGRDEWEIIHFHTPPDNFLAFTGLVRRSTQRDWTLEDAAAAAAKAEAEKLRAEFEAKFKAAASNAPAAPEERASSFLEEKIAPDDGFRKPVDTSRDDDPEAQEDDKQDEWDKLTAAEEDELPTFFEAIKPHMRRNQRGPGMSVGVEYLAKKWDQSEDDLKGALVECGFVLPNDEDAKPEYVEYDGDLFWLNINRRGELWINTKEKPRPVFRPVKAPRVEVEAPAPKESNNARENGRAGEKTEAGNRAEAGGQKAEANERNAEPAEAGAEGAAVDAKGGNAKVQAGPLVPLPEGTALLDKIRPHMRRNRRGPGGSGSASFLSRALRTNETELKAAFAALGLTIPAAASDKPVYSEFGNEVWWLNLDSRGGLWINGREKKEGETAASAASSTAGAEAPAQAAEASAGDAPVSVPASEVAPVPAEAVPAETTPQANVESRPATTTVAESAPAPAETAEAAPVETAETAPVEPPPAPPSTGEAEPVAASVVQEAVTPPVPAGQERDALVAARTRLKESRSGAFSARVEELSGELGQGVDDFVAKLVDAGLRVPERAREKQVLVEHAGEVLWLSKNPKGELWLNAKPAKAPGREGEADEGDDVTEPSEGGEGEGEKKPARRGARKSKKPE